MKFCPECGAELVTQKFCQECGANICKYTNSGYGDTLNFSFDFSALEEAKQKSIAEEKAKWEVGGTPIMGAGPDGDIEWLVIAREGNKALLITKKCLCDKAYNDTIPYSGVTWEQCTLRRWLNTVFYDSYFIPKHRSKILTTTVVTKDNSIKGTRGGNPTVDNVFLLSKEEAETYFITDTERATNDRWWLRSPGEEQYYAVVVDDFGEIIINGDAIDNNYYGVRPAMWVAVD